ncbi:MAG TPA: hypothetical protein VKM55_27030 [Candidatus Lokiarchaeia archaeon]|nr:hypothetical protein [Candidatus Lokiarchaeia archaeon]
MIEPVGGSCRAEAMQRIRKIATAKRLKRTYRFQDSIKPGTKDYDAVPASEIKSNDRVLVEIEDIIPMDGEVIEGVASVDESAITGESAPVIRESGVDRNFVLGGSRVLSDWLIIRTQGKLRKGSK